MGELLTPIKNYPPLGSIVVFFVLGVLLAIFLNSYASMSKAQMLVFYQAVSAPCVPIALLGSYFYQFQNSVAKAFGMSLFWGASALFGIITFYFFTQIISR
jgi:ABC-type phosphate transport system permease subunit